MPEILIESFRLSPQQRHLCALPHSEGSFPYRTHVTALLQGQLDLSRLCRALRHLVERYEILRTNFPRLAGFALPTQVIDQGTPLQLEVYDFSFLSAPEQETALTKIQTGIQSRQFTLAEGPTWNVVLIRYADEQHLLCCDTTTLNADIQTCHILLRELSLLYSYPENEEEEPLQYADLAEWLYDVLPSGEASPGREYWLSSTRALEHPALLPYEQQIDPLLPFAPHAISLEVPLRMQSQLQNLAQQLKVSEKSLLLASWGLVLARLTDQTSLLIGTSNDGRGYQEVEQAVGLFAKSLPLSYHFSEQASYKQIVQQVEKTLTQADEWQEYFSWQLVEAPEEAEELFCPFGFSYEILPLPWQSGKIEWTIQDQGMYQDCFKVNMVCLRDAEHLHVALHYDQRVFEQQDAQRLLQQWQIIHEQVLANPDITLDRLQVLTEQEKHDQISEWNTTQVNYDPEQGIHKIFEDQAHQHPQAAALRYGELLLSYEQLEQQVNRFAHLLLASGIQPGDHVALCLPRDHWTIISLLAILKAGGTYVPLEMDIPPARLQALLQQLTPALIISSQKLQDRLPTLATPVLLVENISQQLAAQPSTSLEIEVHPDTIAYVMYTSGSTGTPKGVEIRHRSISNYTRALCKLLEIQAGWHFATVTSLAADLGNTSIFCALASGGCLHILPYELVTDANALSNYTQKYTLDVLKIVPSHLQTLLTSGAATTLPLKCLVLGGETLPWSLIRQIQQLHPTCSIYNHYGPTEATIGALVHPLGHASQIQIPPSQKHSVPIGRPIANAQTYPLDKNLQLLPIGVTGELYIGGAGVAQGYLSHPDATAEHFVPDPFSHAEGTRLYRTGDLVRYRTDGVLEFIGRQDAQIKLRGYRIELGEIEDQLRKLPGVKEAAAKLWVEEDQEGSLVGYIVPSQQPGPNHEQLRQALSKQLPGYMVPTKIMTLEALPLTTNGKMDRQNLPQFQSVGIEKTRNQAQMPTPIEEVMLGVWQEVLHLKQIDRNHNFFQLGGHSLLGTRVTAQLQTIFGIAVPITWLFEAPTVRKLSRRIAEELQLGKGLKLPALVPAARGQLLPLSFAQQRLWFLDQLEPGSATYLLSQALHIYGPLHLLGLRQALHAVIQRHENLRTTFPLHDEEPIQLIHALPSTPLIVLDLSMLTPSEREHEAQRLAHQEAELPFDLAHGPLLRCYVLLLVAQQEQVLLLTMHHIISDGWSNAILFQELSHLYLTYLHVRNDPLPHLPIQYADYALWQRAWLQGETLTRQLHYWKEQLRGLTPLELPIDHPRPVIQTFQGALLQQRLPIQLTQQLQQLSQSEGVTLFMTLLAAFQVLLARYSGQLDIAVGTPIANRTREEVEGLIGFFVNTLVLRSDLSDDPSFLTLLARVRTTALEAYTHQDVPFEQVVEALQPQRDLSRSPLFQVLFELKQGVEEEEVLGPVGLRTENFTLEQHSAKFELSLVISESQEGLQTMLEYNTDLFASSTIQRLLSHWQTLLEGIVSIPEKPLSALPLLTAAEYQECIEDWNETQSPYPEQECLPQLFEAQVERTPHDPAVLFASEQLSYQELNQRANQLAHHLQTLGVGPDVRVGLCMEPSLELLVAIIAILKAGGAYVSIDPAYPRERVAFLLHDAAITVLLAHERSLEKLVMNRQDVQVLALDTVRPFLDQQRIDNPPRTLRPENLAYILYTSGSTGAPKGVMIPHRGLVNYLHWCCQRYAVTEGSGAPVHSSLHFDLTVTSLFSPLLTGKTTVLLPFEPGVEALSAALRASQNFSLVKITPAHLALLSQQPDREQYAGSTRLFVIGGEQLLAEKLAFWQELAPETQFINEYGPTETVVGCCVYQVPADQHASGPVPIGRPIANTQLYLLNAFLQPVPIGVPGELYIAGAGLARGYLNQPGLTAERFIPNPFGTQGGTRLYKTGDLARYRRDGILEFLGRNDHQVKVRGFRIELGEIEAVIRTHPAISAVAVDIQDMTRGEIANQILIAYVVYKPEQSLSLHQLRLHVAEQLPQYMLPSGLVELEYLPLNSSGKVDRRQLATLKVRESQRSQKDEQGPHNELEELVLQIWKVVLQREHIGLQENFFEIGGHSLLATQIVARLRKVIPTEIPLLLLFEAPTISSLAARLQQQLQHRQVQEIPPLLPMDRTQDLPLSFAQQRLWFLHQFAPLSAAYTIPIAVRLHGQLDTAALLASLSALIQRHESLRTLFEEHDGQLIQRIIPHPTISFPLIDLSFCPEPQREDLLQWLVQQEGQQPFDLTRGPLLRSWLLRISSQDHILLLTMHHIVSDGWSMTILVQEFTRLYQAFREGTPSPLAPLSIQYADYAHWQRTWLQGEILKEQIRYWTQQLQGAHALELPTDYPRPQVPSQRGAQYDFQVDAELALALNQLSQHAGATLFMTLLAAFQVLLYRLSGEEDIVVGTDSANRSQLETEGLIGFFVNLLALKTHIHGKIPFHDLLRSARETIIDAYVHQDFPFEMIVEHLHFPRERGRIPLVNILFVMQNVPLTNAELSGLTVTSIDSNTTSAKFDIALFVKEELSGLSGSVTYSTDLFKEETIKKMMSHYTTLLHAIIAHPESPIDQLEIYSEEEERYRTVQKGKSLQRHLNKLKNFKEDLIDLPSEV